MCVADAGQFQGLAITRDDRRLLCLGRLDCPGCLESFHLRDGPEITFGLPPLSLPNQSRSSLAAHRPQGHRDGSRAELSATEWLVCRRITGLTRMDISQRESPSVARMLMAGPW